MQFWAFEHFSSMAMSSSVSKPRTISPFGFRRPASVNGESSPSTVSFGASAVSRTPSLAGRSSTTVAARFRPLSTRATQKSDEVAWYADGNTTVRSKLNAATAHTFENLLTAQELFESFLRSREVKSDFVSKASDVLWKREVFDVDEERLSQVRAWLAELQKLREEDEKVGYLKLSQAKRWGLGVEGAPNNIKSIFDDIQLLQDDRRRVALLEYEALKRELFLMTTMVAALCSIYCGVVFSFEVSVSYALGAVGSLLYLQLLFRHADHLSEENVASAFRRKHQKKIGVRGSDFQYAFEKAFFGSISALFSPRLLIPVALYILWTSQHKLHHLPLDLQITPLMFGFFAYKAALLVQTFRENKELAMEFEKGNKESGLGS